MLNRRECLETAMKIVCEDRETSYGTPEDNFNLISGLWSLYLSVTIDSKDVAMMMALLKIAREKSGRFKEDNMIDLAGYAACACEIGGNQNERNQGFRTYWESTERNQ